MQITLSVITDKNVLMEQAENCALFDKAFTTTKRYMTSERLVWNKKASLFTYRENIQSVNNHFSVCCDTNIWYNNNCSLKYKILFLLSGLLQNMQSVIFKTKFKVSFSSFPEMSEKEGKEGVLCLTVCVRH